MGKPGKTWKNLGTHENPRSKKNGFQKLDAGNFGIKPGTGNRVRLTGNRLEPEPA